MQRNGLLAHVESLRERLDIQRLGRDQLNDRPPGGIGYRLVYVTSRFHFIQVSACEIKHKYSLVQIFPYLSLRTYQLPNMENIYSRLANLAIRIEGKGQYNIAKYVRATLDSLLRHAAFNQGYATDTTSILADLTSIVDHLEDIGFDPEIVDRLRHGYQVMSQNGISKIPEFPTPIVC
jgi:hypothetical protein